MRPPQSERPRLRKREIAFAVAAGVVAAGGAALVLDQDDAAPVVIVTEGPDNLTYDLAPFDEIATIGPQDIVVRHGETQSVRGEGPPEALAGLEVTVEGGRLTIRPNGVRAISDWERFRATTYYVTVPRLESVSVSGFGEVSVDRIEGERFSGSVRGAGELSIAALQVDDAELSVRGAGELIAAGSARKTRVSIDGSGEVQASGLRSRTAMITVGGPGDVELTVDDDAQVSITGGGNVDIAGTTNCTVSRVGTGNVRCGGSAGEDDD